MESVQYFMDSLYIALHELLDKWLHAKFAIFLTARLIASADKNAPIWCLLQETQIEARSVLRYFCAHSLSSVKTLELFVVV